MLSALSTTFSIFKKDVFVEKKLVMTGFFNRLLEAIYIDSQSPCRYFWMHFLSII